MAYSKPKAKINGDKALPRFRPFWIGNVSDFFTYVYFTVGFV